MSNSFVFDVQTLRCYLHAFVQTLSDWPGYDDRQLRIQMRANVGGTNVEFRTPPGAACGRYEFSIVNEGPALETDISKSVGARQFFSAIDKLAAPHARNARLVRQLVILSFNEALDAVELSLAVESQADLISDKHIEAFRSTVQYELTLHNVSEASCFELAKEAQGLPAIDVARGAPAPTLAALGSYIARLAQPQRYHFALRVEETGALSIFNSAAYLKLLRSHGAGQANQFPLCALDKNTLLILHKLLASKVSLVADAELLMTDDWLYFKVGSLVVRLPTSAPHLLPRPPLSPDSTHSLILSLHELKALLVALDVAYEKARDIVTIEAKSNHKLQLTFSDEARASATIKVRQEVPPHVSVALTRSLLARALDCLPQDTDDICLSALSEESEAICVSDKAGESFVWVPKLNSKR